MKWDRWLKCLQVQLITLGSISDNIKKKKKIQVLRNWTLTAPRKEDLTDKVSDSLRIFERLSLNPCDIENQVGINKFGNN